MDKSSITKLFRMLAYFIGFPLVLCLVLISALQFYGQPAFSSTIWYSIVLVLGMWAVFEIARLIFKLTIKNNRQLQTILIALIALIVMVVPLVIIDYVYINPTYAAVQEEYEAYEITYEDPTTGEEVTLNLNEIIPMKSLAYQQGWFKSVTKASRKDLSMTQKLIDATDKFCVDYQINKWLNFNDFEFDNYDSAKYGQFGKLAGVKATLEKSIEIMEGYIKEYNDVIADGGTPTPAQIANLNLAIKGGSYASDIFGASFPINGWDIISLKALNYDMEYQITFYPYFAAKQFILVGLGLVMLSIVLVAYCTSKLTNGSKKSTKKEDEINYDGYTEEVAVTEVYAETEQPAVSE